MKSKMLATIMITPAVMNMSSASPGGENVDQTPTSVNTLGSMPRATKALMMARKGNMQTAPMAPVTVMGTATSVADNRCSDKATGDFCATLTVGGYPCAVGVSLCLASPLLLTLALPLSPGDHRYRYRHRYRPDGGVLPGVTVSLRHMATGRTFDRVTGVEGGYLASCCRLALTKSPSPAGLPVAHRARRGPERQRSRGDRASLSPGGVSEVVELTGPLLPQTTTAVQNLIDSRQVQELPINNRNFAQLADLAPGVSSDLADEAALGLTSTMSISINGARRNAVNWLVDGVMNVDVGSNITLLSTPTLESIQQFKIITTSYAAEWPRSGGGIINVVTKSGTSRFSGSAYEFFRNDSLNSNSSSAS